MQKQFCIAPLLYSVIVNRKC